MGSALLAIVGTVAGALVSGLLSHLAQRAQRRDARSVARRTEALAAFTSLATSLADHRRAMWVREETRLLGLAWEAARAESHTTRSALTAPTLAALVLLPGLSREVDEALTATYHLRGSADLDTLTARREAALAAADRLVSAAADHFAA
ncbi:protein kilB [Streptomyces sp. BI20]|uniref:protein kilB n=1 Tax=Streptomyces sp. BI20 TaxID=3403460 RepID=UPI003C724320